MEAATAPTAPPAEPGEAVSEASEGPQTPSPGSHTPSQASDGPAEGSDDDRERGEDGRLLSREAANYRRQLRDTQAERDSLREQVNRLQRAEVERLAASAGLAMPGDLFAVGGATLDTLVDDQGAVAAETVAQAVEALLRDRPGLRAPLVGDIGIGRGGTAAGRSREPAVGLSQLLKR